MPELITEEQPRIKFTLTRVGEYRLTGQTMATDLQLLTQLMVRMEELGAAPILNDGLVGGNCACRRAVGDTQAPAGDRTLLVSRSGKAQGAALKAADWVRVTSFDRSKWSAEYESADAATRPSSDTPLLQACLLGEQCRAAYGWDLAPNVALHGHALAEGAGLEAAQQLGLPISDHETLFSTPEDLAALEALFVAHPYPAHNLYIRKGHGFFLLGQTAAEVGQVLEQVVAPIALQQLPAQQVKG